MESKKYEVLGGGTIKGRTPQELLGALRFSSFNPCMSEGIFISEMSERCKFYNKAEVRIDSVEHFIADLERFGFIWETDHA